MNATQAELDAWLGTSEADRRLMREGQLPARMSRFLSPGCLAVAVLPFGAGVGAFAGAFAHDIQLVHDLPMATAIAGGAVIGGAVAYALVKARAAAPWSDTGRLRNMSVRSHSVEVTSVQSSPHHALLTASGRRYRLLLPPPAGLDLIGRLRVFYVDPAESRADSQDVERELMVVGLELE